MTGPRIAPGNRRQLGWFGWTFTRLAGLRTRTAPPALFTVLGRNRRLFRRWLLFAAALMPGGRLPRRDTELVILRVATLRGSDYELRQHVRLGRSAGLTGAEIDRVRDLASVWHGRDRALLAAADALVRDRDLDDERWRALRAELSDVECLEFCLLVTHYDLLATVIGTLRIPPDELSAPSGWSGAFIRGSRWPLARRRKVLVPGCTWAFRQRGQRPPGPRRNVPTPPGRGTE